MNLPPNQFDEGVNLVPEWHFAKKEEERIVKSRCDQGPSTLGKVVFVPEDNSDCQHSEQDEVPGPSDLPFDLDLKVGASEGSLQENVPNAADHLLDQEVLICK